MPRDIIVAVQDRVALVTLNRPHLRNALSQAMIGELTEALEALDGDSAVKVVLLAAVGPHFCAGADVQEMAEMSAAEALLADFAGCCTRLSGVAKPVVAAVQGMALGGGCELVEMCDIVVAAETARFGHPESRLATLPGAGGSQRLTRAVGKALAMDLLLTGRSLSAAEALAAGLVSRVVPEARLFDEAQDIARHLAAASAPVLRMIKQAVLAAARDDDGLTLERSLFQQSFVLDDRQEGMLAFLDKRPAVFQDR